MTLTMLNYIEETNKNLNDIILTNLEKNKKYYNSVLKLLNKIFNTDARTFLKINIVTITINIEILKFYNKIINKFNINKPLFDIDNLDIDNLNDYENIVYIIENICNNLLERLDYKLKTVQYMGKKKLKIICID